MVQDRSVYESVNPPESTDDFGPLKDPESGLTLFKLLFECSRDVILIMDRSGRILGANDAAVKSYGYTRDELRSMSIIELRAPETRRLAMGQIERAMQGGVLFETVHMAKDGRQFPVEVNSEGVGTAGSELIVSIIRDVSDRKNAEFERNRLMDDIVDLARISRQQAAELQSVLENMVDGVFVCDEVGRLMMVNSSGAHLLGMESGGGALLQPSDLSQSVQFRHPDGAPQQYDEQPHVRALSGETVVDSEWLLHNPATNRDTQVVINAAPIRDDEGHIVSAVAVARDVTALRELDRQKDEFISVAAHELKTPVAIVKGYAQALVRKSGDVPLDRRRLVDGIDRGADRIGRVVEDLLDITRLQSGYLELKIEQIDLVNLVADVVDRMALTTSRHKFRTLLIGETTVLADRDRIEQVAVTMLDNAIRYSPAGGTITIEVTAGNKEAIVTVSDEGVGIPAEKRSHIFERFYRAHTSTPYDYGGMGVALYIAREIVLRHGGEMWFESIQGGGSSFHFSLPTVDGDD